MSQTFEPPPWDAPLDVDACLTAIPDGFTAKGMFTLPMIAEARRRGLTLPSARERYLPFVDYPLIEHARILVEAARTFTPELSLRQGLRRLGQHGVDAFRRSTVGRVMWSGATDPLAGFEVIAKAYTITSPPTSIEILERRPGRVRMRAAHVHSFLDSHHIGVFEGILRACGVVGEVQIRLDSLSDGELLCTWA